MGKSKGIDYSCGKIYKIYCMQDPEMVYIGSTTKKYLSQRMEQHRANYKLWKDGNHNNVTVYTIFEKYSVESCIIELIENYPCQSKDELSAREGHYIRTLDCVNRCVAGRTMKQYREDNKDKINEQMKQYYQDNKDKIKEWMKQKIICKCGSHFRKDGQSNHLKSQKHIQFIAEQNKPINRLKKTLDQFKLINEMAKEMNL